MSASLVLLSVNLRAEVSLPAIFGDHMVFQRNQPNPVWGWADPGEKVRVQISGQKHEAVANAEGRWRVELTPMEAGGPLELSVKGKNVVTFKDVLVGEVWVCSGQSNMEWPMSRTNQGALYLLSADQPQIRLISVPKRGTQEPQENFEGEWVRCNPEVAKEFSAVGYYFGLRLSQTLGVPVGLIDNAWGGSAAEAWLPKAALEESGKYDVLIREREELAANYTEEMHAELLSAWRKWNRSGRPEPRVPWPRDARHGNQRPANIFNGMLYPIIGYGIRGVIWYQGESNGDRGYQYRHLFPLMIRTWREQWAQGDFSFYWAQLADFTDEVEEPGESGWPEVREAQTMTLDLPNTGQAVIIDVGEGRDVHPRDKLTVANRLARIALAKDYGYEIGHESPRYKSMELTDEGVLVTFDQVSEGGLWAFDTTELVGFAIAGGDREFVWADAVIVGKHQVLVSSPEVKEPIAVRYGWAMNPEVNLFDRNSLPVTPFRTDQWPGFSEGNEY